MSNEKMGSLLKTLTMVSVTGVWALAVLAGVYLVGQKLVSTPNTGKVMEITKDAPSYDEVTIQPIRGDVAPKLKEVNIDPARTVFVWDAIQGQVSSVPGSVAEIANKIRSLDNGSDPIWVVINSPGGSVFGGNLIVTAVKESKSPVHTLCVQLCASMGFIIHQYGTTRNVLDGAILMSHQASFGAQGERAKVQSMVGLVNAYIEKYEAEVSTRAGMSVKDYMDLIYNDLWMGSDRALELNFTDYVAVVRSGGEVLMGPQRSGPTGVYMDDRRRDDGNDGGYGDDESDRRAKVLDFDFILDSNKLRK